MIGHVKPMKTIIAIYNSFSIRLWRRLIELKLHADYTSCDTSKLCSWLSKVDPQLLQYAYNMLSAGVTVDTLPHLTDDHLKSDCDISNGIHRLRILQAAEGNTGMKFLTIFTIEVI